MSSFDVAFPEPVTVGSLVCVVGKFSPASIRFDVNLICEPSKDEALHCSFRLGERQVVRNHLTRVPFFWGEEERVGGWPIRDSGEFQISMEIEERGVNISVDGKQFAFFQHRLPYSRITLVHGALGADFKSITFQKKRPKFHVHTARGRGGKRC